MAIKGIGKMTVLRHCIYAIQGMEHTDMMILPSWKEKRAQNPCFDDLNIYTVLNLKCEVVKHEV